MKPALTLLLLFLSFAPLHAQEAEYIDSVIAIVEDDVITDHQLSREIERLSEEFARQGQRLPDNDALRRQVLELMITKSIIFQQADSRGIRITDTQLNRTMQNLAKQNGLTLAGFREALLAKGMDYRQFRENIRRELAISRIQSSYASSNVEVSDQEVEDFLQRSDTRQNTEFLLSHILVALPDGASSNQVARARARIESIAEQVRDGEDFARLAGAQSDGPNALQGGDLGWRKPAEIPSLFADVVPTLPVGGISEPLRSASGFHLVMVKQKRSADQVLTRQYNARHILIRTDELTTDEMAQQRLEAIRSRIVDGGADFAELARRHSDDKGSGGLGGDLGWFDEGTMVPEFNAMLQQVEVGEISEVFQSQFGWHFLQLLDKRTVDETDESRRQKVRAQLLEQKKQEVLDLWRQRLRDQAFVKIFDV